MDFANVARLIKLSKWMDLEEVKQTHTSFMHEETNEL